MKTVQSIDELLELKAARFGSFRPARKYQFELAELTPEENERLGVLINSYGAECGCKAGELLLGFGALLLVTLYFTGGGSFATLRWHSWVAFFCWLALFAVVGKTAGLLWARWKMDRLIARTLPKLDLTQTGVAAPQP
ncbi:MAG TPA: hypothetical protein VGW57_16105 [Chthoniobacterales bacterium]|nr:hypothetical protein [Chthoniobacterales bacterium]